MKLSTGFWQTYKEIPNDAEVPSHQLMLRAGLIYKTSAGLYSYLPMGLRSLQKVEKIVREELNKVGCYELMMPVITPAELWKESGRWDIFGPEMLRMKDRAGRDLCVSPTNEEAITDIFKRTVSSYKQLPVTLYQINTKFRDEIRPRYGVMRSREFMMKDAYSFHIDKQSLDEVYETIYQAYANIFKRMGLEFTVVEADGGTMAGGDAKTHEFQVIADSGEDAVIYCNRCGYAANIEKAATKRPPIDFFKSNLPISEIETPNVSSIEDLCNFLKIPAHHDLKSLVYTAINGKDERHYLVTLLGDDELNEVKLKNYIGADHLIMASDATIEDLLLDKGYIGPYNLKTDKLTVIYDSAIDVDAAYVIGNSKDKHYQNFIPSRDGVVTSIVDIRVAKEGDLCPKCSASVITRRGVEVGHIFQLGDKYTKSMGVSVLGANGQGTTPLMGCYGIGISRTVAAAIEQNHDKDGIMWPAALAPYHVYFALISKSDDFKQLADTIYNELLEAGIEVVYDDRKIGPGGKFKDADLLGLPVRLVLGERDYQQDGKFEIKVRSSGESKKVTREELIKTIKELL